MASNLDDILDSDILLIDDETGYAINVPAEQQEPHQWWKTFPYAYERIKEQRKALGLEIVDDLDGSVAKEKKSLIENLFGEEN